MSSQLKQLMDSAERSTESRGHTLGTWKVNKWKSQAVADCEVCGAGVVVNTHPMPNDIDIGGRAVAVPCERRIPERVAREVAETTVQVYWGRGESLSKDQVSALLDGEKDLFDLEVELLDLNLDYSWQLEKDATERVLSEHGRQEGYEEFHTQYPDTYPLIDINLDQLLRNTRAYIGLRLDIELPRYELAPEDLQPTLDLLGVSAEELVQYIEIEDIEYAKEPETEQAVTTKDLAETLVNCYYSGVWVAMLGQADFRELLKNREKIIQEGITLEKGTNLIIHNFFHGASSTHVTLTRDLYVSPEQIDRLYDDGARRYGIQACCGFVADAWAGGFKVGDTTPTHLSSLYNFYACWEDKSRLGKPENVVALQLDEDGKEERSPLTGNRMGLGAIYFRADSPTAWGEYGDEYMYDHCRKVSEHAARKIHPRLFERLDEAHEG
jgi:hypothetical protein